MSNIRIRTEQKKVRVGLYLNYTIYQSLQKEAEKQERSVSNLINLIAKNYFNESRKTMKLKELLFLLSCIVFVVFCLWYAVSEFGKSLDGFKSVEEVEVNKRDGSGKIYIVQGAGMMALLSGKGE